MSFKNHFAFNFLIKSFPNLSCYGKIERRKKPFDVLHVYIFISSQSYAVSAFPLLNHHYSSDFFAVHKK